MIFIILALGWVLKVTIHPTAATSPIDIVERAAVGFIPGWLMIVIGMVFHITLFIIGLYTTNLRESPSEVFGETELTWLKRTGRLFRLATWEALEIDIPHLTFKTRREAQQQLVYVISDKDEAVSAAVLEELGRGVTRLEGTGMYTHKRHNVLLCVYDSDQAQKLRRIVTQVDPAAFVIFTDVKDVRGTGFRPLEA